MKICYVDESGNSNEDDCLVMVGILVDAVRLNRTRQEFAEIFDDIEALFDESLRELKGAKIIHGRDRWRKIDPEQRKRIASLLCDWLVERKHKLVLAAVCRESLRQCPCDGAPDKLGNPWLAGALHVALQIQKANQGKEKNKGNTLLIFDENKKKADCLSEFLWTPPAWTDDYYGRGRKQERLDQIIDTTFTIKSHHAGLVQVADLFAFIFRRYSELHDYGEEEEWPGERSVMDGYVRTISQSLLPRSARWPARTSSACAKWFNAIAPHSLKALAA